MMIDPSELSIAKLQETSHRRYNPLRREWVLVSPHRMRRPWQGQVENAEREELPQYDPDCYLCPGNTRAGGIHNPPYQSTFVFDNDFAALQHEVPPLRVDLAGKELMLAEAESGICRVVCFSPRHDLTLSRLCLDEVTRVVEEWSEQFVDLGARPDINYVQIFENRGLMMGCSNPHPHGQIWASSSIPNDAVTEQAGLEAYATRQNSCLLCDYIELEQAARERIVAENDSFLAVVPFWAVWPFEVLLLAKCHKGDLKQFTAQERTALADVLRRVTARYDHLFQVPFPYSMGFHQSPTDGQPHMTWHFHGHFYPPLLRSATVRKFMVGYEMLASPQRDLTPETAAQRLRAVPDYFDRPR